MYGKHSVLQVADAVLLVSSSGFYRSVEIKARKFGYETITPAISPMKQARTIGLVGGARMGVKAATLEFSDMTINVGVPGEYVDDGYFRRADDSQLVKLGEFKMKATVDAMGGPVAFMSAQAEDSVRNVTVSNPDHDGEALHERLRLSDGQMIVTPVQSVEFTATVSSTNRADFRADRTR